MFRGNWLSNTATFGIVALCCLLALVFGEYIAGRWPFSNQNTSDYEYNHQAADNNHNSPESGSIAENERALPYQAICQAPVTDKQYDLCQQWRMAEAAKEAADNARYQLWLSFMGLIGLIATVIYAAKSARAASDAAMIAGQTLSNSERPWIAVDARIGSSLVFKDGEGRLTIDFICENSGTTRAINLKVTAHICPMPEYSIQKIMEISERERTRAENRKSIPIRRLMGHAVFPKRKFTFHNSLPISATEIQSALNRLPGLDFIAPSLVGCVTYLSPIDLSEHQTGFIFHIYPLDEQNRHVGMGTRIEDGETAKNKLILQREFLGGHVY